MKRQSIYLILLLLQILFICAGCGSSDKSAAPQELAAPKEPAAVTEEAAAEEAIAEEAAVPAEASLESEMTVVEDVVGIFEGLEDNHTAIFSFDGAETAFFFEDPAVHDVLFEAVSGSSYTLSYKYTDSTGHIIYKISEH